MNRITISIIALLIVIALATAGHISLDNTCDDLAKTLDEIKETAIDKDQEKAIELSKNVVKVWTKKEKVISLLIDHREIDEIEQTIKSLPIYARQDDMEKLEEKASVGAERVRHIKDKEKISAENIF